VPAAANALAAAEQTHADAGGQTKQSQFQLIRAQFLEAVSAEGQEGAQ